MKPRARQTPSPTALLCERCGYDLSTTHADRPCPECGRPVADSLPERRAGTPWQRRRPFPLPPWLATVAVALATPRTLWRTVRLPTLGARRGTGGASLLLLSTLAAALLPATGLVVGGPRVPPASPAYAALFAIMGWAVLIALSMTEYAGIRFFGARAGWRVTPAVAITVVAHAAAGWIPGGLLFAVLWPAVQHLQLPSTIAAGRFSIPGDVAAALAVVLVTFAVSLLWFELLVYHGVRALRFASPPTAAADARRTT